MDYQYLKLIVSSLHVVLIILSGYSIYLYNKNVVFEKTPIKDKFLSIFDLKELKEIGFFIFIIILNLSFLLNFYERISVYSYKIFFMSICVGLFVIIIRNKKVGKE